jgi:hypothetical protein
MKHPIGKKTEGGQRVEYIELRDNRDGTADILAYIEMPRNSVLAGQCLKQWQDTLPIEEARAAYPNARFYHALVSTQVTLDHLDDGDY